MPRAALQRTAFNLEEIDAALREDAQRGIERARLMLHADDERHFVRVLFRFGLRGEQHESRVILAVIFQVLEQNRAAVELRSMPAGNRGERGVTPLPNFAEVSMGGCTGRALN